MYDFFVQPQIDKSTNDIFGYEALMRKKINDKWIFPNDFNSLSIPKQTQLIFELSQKIKRSHNNVKHLSFNLNREQASDSNTLGELILLQKYIFPMNLIVELTEALPLKEVQFMSAILHQHHIELVIDDVGSDSNIYENVGAALPYVDRIKFALQNFRAIHLEKEITDSLAFWTAQANKYRLDMILEGIEGPGDQMLAKKSGIDIQQGYLYGKPELFK